VIRRLACLAILLALAACSTLVETDQARLCRMALPALAPEGAIVTVLGQREFEGGRALRVDYLLSGLGAPAASARFPALFSAASSSARSRRCGRPISPSVIATSRSTACWRSSSCCGRAA
jgi:hypothetical protein